MLQLKKYLRVFLVVSAMAVFFGTAHMSRAQTPEEAAVPASAELSDVYYRAKVIKILETGEKQYEEGEVLKYQTIELEIVNGNEKGKRITIDHGATFVVSESQMVKEGEQVILAKTPAAAEGREVYYITDKYRVKNLAILALVFFILAIYFGRKRGFTSIIGLVFTVLIIFYYILPSISKGGNPFWVCIVGALAILLSSFYLSHGFNRRTSIALLSSFISLALAVVVNIMFVSIAKLAGTGAEEVFYLQLGQASIDLRGLLLGGIIIGVLGVLDDVTTSQTAAIDEVSLANPNLTFKQLYTSGMSIGREHIASLINTLVLAYAGVSLPLLLLYSMQKTQPVWMMLNSAFVAEEIVRTLVGSTVLVLAVPLTSILAAWFCSRKKIRFQPEEKI